MERHPNLVDQFLIDRLTIKIFENRNTLGTAAATIVAQEIHLLLAIQEYVSIIFAAAPSQDEFLAALAAHTDIDWSRVIAFQMDEYIGISSYAPQNFGRYLREHLFDRVYPGKVLLINGNANNLDEECARYSSLLQQYPLDITCAGVGENGHLAFNDPPNVDFGDRVLVRVVKLAEISRQQQVRDGCFAKIGDVPSCAVTVTIPLLISANFISCVVPKSSKAEAIRQMLLAPISVNCPASILRKHPKAVLFLDRGSSQLINSKIG